MTQEDKELLLRDLCARLPYEVKGIRIYKPREIVTLNEIIPNCQMNPNVGNGSFCELGFDKISDYCTIVEFKPYLFPLSSMTEEQKQEYTYIVNYISPDDTDSLKEGEFIYVEQCDQLLYFYHINHLDYRGLIEKGIAIDATGLDIYL